MLPHAATTTILLIEEDEEFALKFIRSANAAGVEVEWFDEVTEISTPGQNQTYHAMVAGMSTDPVSGLDIAEYADTFLPDLPLLLVAENEDAEVHTSRWPVSVQAIIPRSRGAQMILESALDLAAVAEIEMPPRLPDEHLALRSHRALHS